MPNPIHPTDSNSHEFEGIKPTSNDREELYKKFKACFAEHGILITNAPSDLLRAAVVAAFEVTQNDRAQLLQRIESEGPVYTDHNCTVHGCLNCMKTRILRERDAQWRALLTKYKEGK